MANIEINGIPIQAEDGAMVIEAADAAGITIPRFCYHTKLSIAANCRMCLVEVEKVGKPLPACATPVTDGMKVFTRSPKAIAAQRAVMEFLLINHPLDCPICDQGGECDLQEMAMGFGSDVSRFSEGKRVVPDKNLGPLIATDMTRCIHCTRCVRFGQEIAGIMELGATGRGEHMRIGTYVERAVASEISGNVIDLCPVGALTSKPYRYTARPWELIARNSISPHDCVGANLRIDVRGGIAMRVLPEDNEAVNECWLADRDRFSYAALGHADRLTAPQVKRDGKWQAVDWDTALTFAVEGLGRVGADQLGAWAAPWSTTEELYLLQKLMRGIGSGHIDHRIRQLDFSDQADLPAFPGLGGAIADLEKVDAALLIGSNIRHEQPLLGVRLRKAALAGGQVSFINPLAYSTSFPVAAQIAVAPAAMVGELAAVAKALAGAKKSAPEGLDTLLDGVAVGARHQAIAEQLANGKHAVVLLGSLAAYHPQAGTLRRLAALVAELSGARLGFLPESGNSAGAWLAGAVPHRAAGGAAAKAGKDWRAMAAAGLKGYLLLGLEPDLDCIDPMAANNALNKAQFVVALTAYDSPALRAQADVLLPIALFAETSGTYVNAEGRWQSFNGAVNAPGQARPAWKLLRVMGNLLDLAGFEYMASDDVLAEVRKACADVQPTNGIKWQAPQAPAKVSGLVRITDFPLYAVDPMVRRAAPLQATVQAGPAAVHANAATLAKAGLTGAARVSASHGEGSATLALVSDERVPDGCVYIPSALAGSATLGGAFAAVEIKPV